MPTETFTADNSWTVPADVTGVKITCNGQDGEGNADADPSDGGFSEGDLSVTPGETLYIRIGYGGGNGPSSSGFGDPDAGDGGGGVDVRQGGTALSDQVIVAGGGGGAGSSYTGGAGGGTQGGDGNNGFFDQPATTGGTQTEGGTGSNEDGSRGQGGDGGSAEMSGGGGGGGYYGGGGSAGVDGSTDTSAAGGSGYIGGVTNATTTAGGTNNGEGSVVIEYVLPPENLTADTVRYRSVDLSWDSVTNADEYTVYRDGTQIDTVSGGTTTYTDTGLSPTTSYSWEVTATVDGTESGKSDSASATTGGDAPGNLSITSIDDDVSLTWTDTNDDEDGYEIYRSTESGVDTSSSPLATVGANTKSYTDTNALDGTTYHYRVVATRNGERGNDSSEVSGTTTLPAPTNLSHPGVGDSQADYSWTTNHDNGETRVEYRESGATTWQTYSTLAYTETTETVDGLLNGKQYESRVVAQTPDTTTEDI